jgi:hypothetical protein
MSYVIPAPAYWYGVPEAERATRCVLLDETCTIDNQHFLIKGNIEIPVHGQAQPFVWTVWSSLSQASFERALRLWEDPRRRAEPPYFGWLSVVLPGYPNTLELAMHVHSREVGARPSFELEPTDHPLAVEQQQGISLARVQEFAELALHPH